MSGGLFFSTEHQFVKGRQLYLILMVLRFKLFFLPAQNPSLFFAEKILGCFLLTSMQTLFKKEAENGGI
jgi:hypothetical protein